MKKLENGEMLTINGGLGSCFFAISMLLAGCTNATTTTIAMSHASFCWSN